MATVGYDVFNLKGGVKVVRWVLPNAGDTGIPFECAQYADKSAQVTGTLSTGTLYIEGSNFPSSETYATLHNPIGAELAFTTLGAEQLLENTFKVRPRLATAGGPVTVHLCVSTPTNYDIHEPSTT